MKNLFDTATATEIKERIGRLGPGSTRQWGKMSAAQAMAQWTARSASTFRGGSAELI